MTGWMCRTHALFVGAALVALPGCGTQEISADPDRFTYVTAQTSPDQGTLTLAIAPTTPTYEQQQAGSGNPIPYHLAVDGKQLVSSGYNEERWPVTLFEGGEFGAAFLAPGDHHFTIRSASDGQTIFDGDHDIAPERSTFLYLFGDRPDALESRWASVPLRPAPGIQHVGVMNLVRSGQNIEMVSCADGPASACTAVSPALARGESFAGDFPLTAAIGFRQVPTDAVPAPRVQPLSQRLGTDPQTGMPVPTSIMAAPTYMSAQGDIWSYFL
jgi:hypothetical protein